MSGPSPSSTCWAALLLLASVALGCGRLARPGARDGQVAAFERHLATGRQLARQGRLAAAAAAFEDATYAEPDNAEAYFLLARAQLELGRSYPALDALQRAERLRPGHEPQRLLLGRVYLRLGRLDEAERIVTSAVETWPRSPRAQLELGRLRLQQGRLELAEASLQEALRLAPRLPGAQELLGRVLLRLGRLDQAIARFNEAIQQRECDDLAHGGLATALVRSRAPGRALAEFRRASECAGEHDDTAWRAGLSLAYAAEGRFGEAARGLAAVERLFPAPALAVLRRRLELAERGWDAVGCTAHETICAAADSQLWSAVLLLYVLGAPDAAEPALRQSLNDYDGDATTHWLMAATLAELGRAADARLALERASAWQPTALVQAAIDALRATLETDR